MYVRAQLGSGEGASYRLVWWCWTVIQGRVRFYLQVVVEGPATDVLTHGCILPSVHMCYSGGWWQASGQWHVAAQPEGELALSMDKMVEVRPGVAQADVLCLQGCSHLSWWLKVRLRTGNCGGEGLRQLGSVMAHACGGKAGEIYRGPWCQVLAVGFISGKILWVCLKSRCLWSAVTHVAWLLVIAFAFLPCASWLRVWSLPIRVGWNQSGTFVQSPTKGAAAGCSSCSSFPSKRKFLGGKFLFGGEQCWLGEWDDG